MLAEVFNDAPLLMVSGIDLLKTLAVFKVIAPVLAIMTPPVAANGVIHSSEEAVLAVVVLYRNVAFVPYVTAPVVTAIVAVPSIESTLLTVGVVANVFAPEPKRVRLSYVVTFAVWAAPVYLTVFPDAVAVSVVMVGLLAIFNVPVEALVKLALTAPVLVSVIVPLLVNAPPTVKLPVVLSVMVSLVPLVKSPVTLRVPLETVVFATMTPAGLEFKYVAAALVTLKVPVPTVTVSALATPAAPLTVIVPAPVKDTVDDVAIVELMVKPPLMVMLPVLADNKESQVLEVPPVNVTSPPTVNAPVKTVILLTTAAVGWLMMTLLVTLRLEPAAKVNLEAKLPVAMVTDLAFSPAALTEILVEPFSIITSSASPGVFAGVPLPPVHPVQVPVAFQLPVPVLEVHVTASPSVLHALSQINDINKMILFVR